MRYMLLCYNDESITSNWSMEEDELVMERLSEVHRKWADHFGPLIRLEPTTTARTYRKADGVVIDGPYAETKEQLLGAYVIDVDDPETVVEISRDLAAANPGGAYEIRPVMIYYPDGRAVGDGGHT